MGIDYEEFSEKKSMLVVDLLRWLQRKEQEELLVKWLEEDGSSFYHRPKKELFSKKSIMRAIILGLLVLLLVLGFNTASYAQSEPISSSDKLSIFGALVGFTCLLVILRFYSAKRSERQVEFKLK